VTIRFFGVFRNITGKNKLVVKFKEAVPLKEAIKEILEEMPRLKQTLVDPDLEDPRPNTLILVNEREISVLNGLETMLKDGDEVIFIPVLHAG
jgi:molybdopterin synthase sulfur carrier subunit